MRHRKENLKKCSLRGLEQRSDLRFFTYPTAALPSFSNYLLLAMDAPVLKAGDCFRGIFLIDGTWKYAETMYRQLPQPHLFEKRSLPGCFHTAYPRRQEDCADPDRGLASVEALCVAYCLLGRDGIALLDHYHWKENFLNKNSLSFRSLCDDLDLFKKMQ
ncbi:MAG TPA: hypothetical protein VGJ00_08630 [Rhabdochlamydiaceae bacterium]